MQENVLVLASQCNPFKIFIRAGKMEEFHICVLFLSFPFTSSVVFSLELHVHIALISVTPRAEQLTKR